MRQKQIILLALSFIFSMVTNAQDLPSNRSIFIEGLGNGLTYSVNYDTRFGPGSAGLGGRGGVGFLPIQGVNITSFPFLVNYLWGNNGHFLEVGAGATILAVAGGSDTVISIEEFNRSTGIGPTFSLGYRYQPLNGGILFRAGIAPIIDTTGSLPYWPQISLGYAF